MVDMETLLATLYFMVDEFCQSQLPAEIHPGPQGSLTQSEVVTLCLFGQWACFPSERAFDRYAQHHLRAAFPTLPHRTQFNRLLRAPRAGLPRGRAAIAQCQQWAREAVVVGGVRATQGHR